MKKKLVSGMLTMSMCLGMVAGIPAMAASEEAAVDGGGETISVLCHSSWRTSEAKEVFDYVADKCNVVFEFEEVPEGTAGEELIAAKIQSGEVPDILWWQGATTSINVLGDCFEELNRDDWTENYSDAVLDSYKQSYEGRMLCAPFGDVTVFGMIYNKQIFADNNLEIPTTWDELMEECETLKEKGIIPVYTSGAADNEWTLQIISIDSRAKQEIQTPGAAEKLNTHKALWTDMEYEKYALEKQMELIDTQYSNPQFSRYTSYESGFVLMEDADTEKTGVMTTKAQMVVPCEFDNVNILNENWIAAYLLKEATESDYDFQSYSDNGYYQIETAVIYHIGETETASVKLTRDQVAELQADGDYLNVQDRSSGKVTTYDASFNAVAAADSIWNFGEYSYENVVLDQISDKSGHGALRVYDDGYVMGSDWDSEAGKSVYGVTDMNGEVILPFEYDRIHYNYGGSGRCLSTKGYFCVEKDDKIGFVTKGGEVSCELKYDSENFECDGLAGTYKNGDGTYTIIAADGTESGPYPNYPHGRANGMIFEVSTIDGNPILVDWHGNELLKGYSYYSFSDSGNYFVTKKTYADPTELFTINGAEVIGVNGNAGGTGAVSMPEATEPETQQTEAPAEAETEAPQEMEQIPETQAETAAAEVAETEAPAATGGSKEEILPLLQSASALVEADAAANKAAILTLLTQAKEKAEGSYPDAASVIGGAITLLDTDSPDSASVLALLNSASTILG